MSGQVFVKTGVLICGCWIGLVCSVSGSQAGWEVGFSKREITPAQPLRLSGYGNRTVPSEGIDTPLEVRAVALREQHSKTPFVLLSVDTIGFPAALTQEILQGLQDAGVDQNRFVVCCTHSHTAPHMGLGNLFAMPPTAAEQQLLEEYRGQVRDECIAAVQAAVKDFQPARLFHNVGEVTFARNRRVIQEGIWKGFGESPEGPVDHTLPVLKVTDESGETVRGWLFNYACHCTTFGGDYNRINGDWAGYAARGLEAAFPGSIALCTIGCGADQNPPRVPARALQDSQMCGAEIVAEVQRLQTTPWKEISGAPTGHFGFAGLPIDRPSVAELRERLQDRSPQVRRHAEVMLETHQRMGRLPESYPMPIQVWRLGPDFSMVFLGGEVCVEYALRLKRELGDQTWVNAYCNDVFAYVVPERMRAEGGYEVDFSMIYYLQPGRWSSGTEEVIIKRVHELHAGQNLGNPLSPEEALGSMQVAPGFRLELVAAEPLVYDPVNLAFGPDGKLWVVEMSDYPRGLRDQPPADGKRHEPWDGIPGGRIKILYDDNADGRYDRAEIFAENLTFPTGVWPWQGGVIVSAAPDIYFLKDTDGDGRADHREVLYSGFEPSNPQHRINGFEYALDGSLHLASGVSSGHITSTRTGQQVNMSGRDLRIMPLTGGMEPTSGRSQYGRCRDDLGHWYGNTNTEPLFHYIIEDADLRRNPFVASPSPRIYLSEPRYSPPIYARSRTLDRFNDLHTADRFTSACSPLAWRNLEVHSGPAGEELAHSLFICEPVHNLVSRIVVDYQGLLPHGSRAHAEQQSEFLASSDPWFRPVRLVNGPDGALWLCDMYRAVIEHPEWIPEAWQERIDIYAGQDRGRIYRIVPASQPVAQPVSAPASASSRELVQRLLHPSGWQRDMAQQLLVERGLSPEEPAWQELLKIIQGDYPLACRIQALWTAHLANPQFHLSAAWRKIVLSSDEAALVRQGLKVFSLEPLEKDDWQPLQLVNHPAQEVRFELALRLGDTRPEARVAALTSLAIQHCEDPWLRAAILSSAKGVAGRVLFDLLREVPPAEGRALLADGLLATLLGDDPGADLNELLTLLRPADDSSVAGWQLEIARGLLQSLDRKQKPPATLGTEFVAILQPLQEAARKLVADAQADLNSRVTAVELLGREPAALSTDLPLLTALLTAVAPPELQLAAVDVLIRLNETRLLIERLPGLGPQQQQTAQIRLLSKSYGPAALVNALQEGRLSPSDLSAAARDALLNSRQPQVREQAAAILAHAGSGDRLEVVQQYSSARELTADLARGKLVFEKRCAACHRHSGVGVEVGPKLAALTDKSADYLITSILDPNRAVDSRYRAWSVALNDGRVLSGMITEETATSIALATADGRQQVILRRDIEELQPSKKSFMPEGLERDLSLQDLADVMEFLRQP
jgi:putative membrane-bound dehydrogenase-like protein